MFSISSQFLSGKHVIKLSNWSGLSFDPTSGLNCILGKSLVSLKLIRMKFNKQLKQNGHEKWTSEKHVN